MNLTFSTISPGIASVTYLFVCNCSDGGVLSRELDRESGRKHPSMGYGHVTIPSSPFVHPAEIWGREVQVLGCFSNKNILQNDADRTKEHRSQMKAPL